MNTAAPVPSPLRQDLTRLDWSKYDPWASARCLPGMLVALGIGLYFHQPAAGIVTAGGMLSVGFASFRRLQGSQILPMMLTAFGMGCSACVGTLAGNFPLATCVGAGLLSFLYGLMLVFTENASWIALQCVIAFLVASAFAAMGWHALIRGGLVFLGGILQAGIITVLTRSARSTSLRDDLRSCHPLSVLRTLRDEIWPEMMRQVNHQRPMLRYAIRLSGTLVLATLLARTLHQMNAYWLPMTTLIVMKPDFYRTYTNGLLRVFGTFAGVILASILTLLLHPHPYVLIGLVLVFAWSCFAMQKVNYALFTCVLTSWIVFLVAIVGLPQLTVTGNRLLDTALGSLIALGSRTIGPRWENVATPAAKAEKAVSDGSSSG